MTKITWLGHATFELQFASGDVLLLDPWITGQPKYPKGHKMERVDAVAFSHGHFDHVADVIPVAEKFAPKHVVGIVEVAGFFEKKGVKNTVGMNKGGSVDLGFVKLTMTHALHTSSMQDGDNVVYGGEAAGFLMTLPDGRRAYFAGDTSIFSEMALIAEIYRPELAFLPIGGFYTMDPVEAAYAARLLKVKSVIPMHYGTFPALVGKPKELEQHLKDDGIKVWELQPGTPVTW
ncbi:MAG TPA: metal-dependent hydrolase [Bryobacteraceae bacterium]|nr:metal-dependent hydrolase [Bryobacteraceae bacterium]